MDWQLFFNNLLNTSKQVGSEIHDTQRRVAELNALVQSRVSEAQKLNAKIEGSKARIDSLTKSLDAQSQKILHLTDTLERAETQKSVLAVRQTYPALYAARVATSNEGYLIDAKAKSASDIYLLVTMWEGATATINEAKFAAALEGLREGHYTLFQRAINLNANSGAGGSSANVAWIGQGVCDAPGISLAGPPCIIYFKEDLKEKASQVKALVASAQTISDDRVRFLSPKTMSSNEQELLQKSGLDMVVVLGNR